MLVNNINKDKARTPTQLIEELVNCMSCWDKYENYYLKIVVPMLVSNPEKGVEKERQLLRELRPQLTQEEWRALPQIMKDYRNGKQREFDSERLKREILEKEALEVEQRQREELEKVERERIQRESLQKKLKIGSKSLLQGLIWNFKIIFDSL